MSCDHPNIWHFLQQLKTEQASSERRIEQALAGVEDVRKKKYVDLDKRIKSVVLKFNETGAIDFLRGIAHNLA